MRDSAIEWASTTMTTSQDVVKTNAHDCTAATHGTGLLARRPPFTLHGRCDAGQSRTQRRQGQLGQSFLSSVAVTLERQRYYHYATGGVGHQV